MGPWESGRPVADVRRSSPPCFLHCLPALAPQALAPQPFCVQGVLAWQTPSGSSLPTSGPQLPQPGRLPVCLKLPETPGDATHTHWGLRTLKRGPRAGLLSRFCASPTPMGQGQALTTPAGGHPQTSDRHAMSQPAPEGPHLTPVLLAGAEGWGGGRAAAFSGQALLGG